VGAVVCLWKSINFSRSDAQHNCDLQPIFWNPFHIGAFYNVQAIGVKVQNGYGLTETSPVIAARRPRCNVSYVSTVLRFMCLYVPMCV